MNRHLGVIRDRVQVNVLFEPRDLWVGVYREESFWEMGELWTPFYIAPIPTLVVLLTIKRRPRRERDEW